MYDWLLAVHVLATMSLSEKSFLWTPFLKLYNGLLSHIHVKCSYFFVHMFVFCFPHCNSSPLRKGEDLLSGIFWVCNITCHIVSVQCIPTGTEWRNVPTPHGKRGAVWSQGPGQVYQESLTREKVLEMSFNLSLLMDESWFTMLCWLSLYNNVIQPQWW